MDRRTERIYELRRETAKKNAEERIKRIYLENPKLQEWDSLIAQKHIRMGRAKITGQDVMHIKREIAELRAQKNLYMKEHHLLEEDFEVQYCCALCSDTGYTVDAQGRYVPCSCLKELTVRDIAEKSNMGGRIKKETFENFKIELFDDSTPIALFDGRTITQRENILSIKQEMESFAQSLDTKQKGAVFWGEVGLGKSYMSSAVARRAIECGRTVIYFSIHELMDCLESYVFHRERYEKIYHAGTRELIFRADLLIVDDLGSEITNQFVLTELFHIINSRTEKGKKMIISTNKDPLELRTTYGERIYYRMAMHFDFYQFIGENLRRNAEVN